MSSTTADTAAASAMMSLTTTSAAEKSIEPSTETKARKKIESELRKRIVADRKIKELVTDLSIKDVVCADGNSDMDTWVNIKGHGFTRLLSIKGTSTNDLTVKMLEAVLKFFKIGSYRRGNKKQWCDLIVSHATSKQVMMAIYPEISSDYEEDKSPLPSAAKKKKQAKSTKPDFVKNGGTLYRFLNAFFSQSIREDVSKLGTALSRDQLDRREMVHKEIWSNVASTYNSNEDETLEKCMWTHIVYDNFLVDDQLISEYDGNITTVDALRCFDYLTYHYNIAVRKKNQSGKHADFSDFIGDKYYLMYYKQWLDSAPGIDNLVVAIVPEDVFHDSGDSGDSGSSPKSAKKKPGLRQTPTSKGEMSSALVDLSNASQERNTIARKRIEQCKAALEIARQADKRKQISDLTELRAKAKKQYLDSSTKLGEMEQSGRPYDDMVAMFLRDDIAIAMKSYTHFTASLQGAIAVDPAVEDNPIHQPNQTHHDSFGKGNESDDSDENLL
jgi:hypothetical protein